MKKSAIPVVTMLGKLTPQEDPERGMLAVQLAKGPSPTLERMNFDPTGRTLVCLDCQQELMALDCKLKKHVQIAKLRPVTAWTVLADRL
jgi:hypothetical protein